MTRKLNVLLVCKSDWANVAYEYSQALKSIGVDAVAIIGHKHSLGYPHQGIVARNPAKIKKYAIKADVIHYMHSQKVDLGGIDINNKAVVVSHTGSAYRNRSGRLNKIFNPIVQATIVGGCLGGKGAKNEHWLSGGIVDAKSLTPSYERIGNKIVIGHYPSSVLTKKSADIKKAINLLSGNFIYRTGERVPWIKNMARFRLCDIYVERLTSAPRGFGISAIEAAAVGKIVITSFSLIKEYKENVGTYTPYIAQTVNGLRDKLLEIMALSEEEQLEKRKEMREWVIKCHSYEAVGNRLLKVYNSIL